LIPHSQQVVVGVQHHQLMDAIVHTEEMTAIQGTGKDGQMYRGYFCAAPKGAIDKCKNQYVRAGSPEWATFVAEQVK
jgi:hypothetical protein